MRTLQNALLRLAIVPAIALFGPGAPGAPGAAPVAGEGGGLTLDACDFDRGNVRVSRPGEQYAGKHACIWNGGEIPNRAEYEIQFPVAGEYGFDALYAAAEGRPVEILVDGTRVRTGLAGVTGGWDTRCARWETQGALRVGAGAHLIALERSGPMPHICALRLSPRAPLRAEDAPARPPRAERERAARVRAGLEALRRIDIQGVSRAVADMAESFPDRFPDRHALDRQVADMGRRKDAAAAALARGDDISTEIAWLEAERRRLLLANPLLDFDRLLVVRRNFAGDKARRVVAADAGFVPANYLIHTAVAGGAGWDNEIAVVSDLRGAPRLERLYAPAPGRLLRDLRLDWSGDRMLFSTVNDRGRWALCEVARDGGGERTLTPDAHPDVDYFDGCYLPDGRVVLCATGNYVGLPCLDGDREISSLYLLDPPTRKLRRLTFDQDSANDPTVLPDGRVLYQRWEYSDIPHYFSRRRMTMNPDGSAQLALHGSNCWFPPAFRFARPVPDHPTRLVGIISGHHDFGDCGRLAILDPGLAGGYPFRHRPASKQWGVEGERIVVTPEIFPATGTGFVQLVPGRDQPVAGTVCDAIVGDVYRKEDPALVTHPHPLSSKYFLVSMKPAPDALWGIYLVDAFDNATRIAEVEGAALFEPQPFVARTRPPAIADRVTPGAPTAEVHIADIHAGPGLAGVPRGVVKRLRVFSYHFGYLKKAGFPLVGIQAGWDVKRVLGTATVEPDGSACFTVPANTPVSLQPLDAEGRALQLMRSWFVGMPGERVSCVGCHEARPCALPARRAAADLRGPETLAPWQGAPRPFAFAAEVYPVLERYCIGCHRDAPRVGPRNRPTFRDPDAAYDTLHPYVHRPGVESDMALLVPMEYHASTSPLIQMLEKGHHGVTLSAMDRDARERLYCWIDLNVPRAGRWDPPPWQGRDQRARRIELAREFGGDTADPEGEAIAAERVFQTRAPVAFTAPPLVDPPGADGATAAGFPMTAEQARVRQGAGPAGARKSVALGNGVSLDLAWIPAGEFVMGSVEGAPDERPRCVVRVPAPFWMGVTEVTNSQFALFDPAHDTRYIDMHSLDRVVPGHIANHADQPVARVPWARAMAFCRWLAHKSGLEVSLPTEAQWEWAARCGTATRFSFGSMETDFGRFANLADRSLRWFQMGYDGPSTLQRRRPYPPEMNFPLHDERFSDAWHVVDYVGRTAPNFWGLQDMTGNVSEWTRSCYRPYPYADDDRNAQDAPGRRVARGGSWADRPADAGSSVRRAFAPWQAVYDVGFRVAALPPPHPGVAAAAGCAAR